MIPHIYYVEKALFDEVTALLYAIRSLPWTTLQTSRTVLEMAYLRACTLSPQNLFTWNISFDCGPIMSDGTSILNSLVDSFPD